MSDQDYITPCARPENNPEDWFIEKDGRQYIDEPILTRDQILNTIRTAPADAPPDDELLEILTQEQLAANLVKRRHAKDMCFRDCYLRTKCLGVALADKAATSGTWGGYYPEELRQIKDLRDERQRERDAASHDADAATSE